MEAPDGEGGDLLDPRPPTEYRRMLSWQLSHVRPSPAANPRRARKEREKRRKRLEGGAPESSDDDGDREETGEGDEEGSGDADTFAYLVVNSEGEEECYYSAPESPLDSEDDGEEGEGEREEVCLPPQEMKRGRKSKKAKKRIRNIVRLAAVEFFGPLCDLVESSLEVNVGGVKVSDRVDVPTLSELCVRSIHSAKLQVQPSPDWESEDELHLPFLIHVLLGAHRAHRSMVGAQVRWLERMLAAWDINKCEFCQEISPPLAFCIRPTWNLERLEEPTNPFKGLHLPLPCVSPSTMHLPLAQTAGGQSRDRFTCLQFTRHIASLVHFANFLYPLFTVRGSTGPSTSSSPDSLSPSQAAAVAHVNRFLSSRYKNLSDNHSEFLKVWPGYVYWARGQAKLALSAFTTALDSLKHDIDKAVTLNEMGRMMVMFGDRYTASLFFSKSLDISPQSVKSVFEPSREQVQTHLLSLQASLWDCGLLTPGVSRQAAQAWHQMLQSLDGPTTCWYLSAAAVESRMMVHSCVPVGSPPDSPISTVGGSSPTRQWLTELLELVSSLSVSHPVLHYHHSLLLAMAARPEESRRAFLRFCDDYLFFMRWPEDAGFPGDPFNTVTNRRLLNPWLPLHDMLNEQGLTHAPLLRLKWRTRLLHPMFPYCKTNVTRYLADHCSSAVNLRLSDTGYITADLHMDFPPMRSVFLDPYTGSVCFSRSASLHHYLSGPVGDMEHKFIIPDDMAMPWPLRVFESEREGVVVELVMTGSVDPELGMYFGEDPLWTNQSAVLHWYCGSSHCQLNLRSIIRRERKKSMMDIVQRKVESIEEEMKPLLQRMEKGDVLAEVLLSYNDYTEVPSKYKKMETRGISKSKRGGNKQRRQRYHLVRDFNMTLSEYVVYGEATVALFFIVKPCYYSGRSDPFYRQALVVVNCSSQESFLNPRIHCTGDSCGFVNVYPSKEYAVLYPSYHLPHTRYMVVFQHNNYLKTCSQSLLDWNGDIVYDCSIPKCSSFYSRQFGFVIPESAQKFKFSLGNRIFHWTKQNGVSGFNLQLKDKMQADLLGQEPETVVPIPGCVLVHTARGLSLLHPGSLQVVDLDHPKQTEDEANWLSSKLHFLAGRATFAVISVFNAEGPDACGLHSEDRDLTEGGGEGEGEGEGDESVEERRRELNQLDFGSCCVALTLNSRLLVLQVPHKTEVVRVLVDIVVPGKVTEFHDMKGLGFMVSVTQFPDCFREEIYWLSPSGKLRGMLPCLGAGRHSFLSLTLPPPPPPSQATGLHAQPEQAKGEGESGGQCVFFNDGQGGVCCIHLDTD